MINHIFTANSPVGVKAANMIRYCAAGFRCLGSIWRAAVLRRVVVEFSAHLVHTSCSASQWIKKCPTLSYDDTVAAVAIPGWCAEETSEFVVETSFSWLQINMYVKLKS